MERDKSNVMNATEKDTKRAICVGGMVIHVVVDVMEKDMKNALDAVAEAPIFGETPV